MSIRFSLITVAFILCITQSIPAKTSSFQPDIFCRDVDVLDSQIETFGDFLSKQKFEYIGKAKENRPHRQTKIERIQNSLDYIRGLRFNICETIPPGDSNQNPNPHWLKSVKRRLLGYQLESPILFEFWGKAETIETDQDLRADYVMTRGFLIWHNSLIESALSHMTDVDADDFEQAQWTSILDEDTIGKIEKLIIRRDEQMIRLDDLERVNVDTSKDVELFYAADSIDNLRRRNESLNIHMIFFVMDLEGSKKIIKRRGLSIEEITQRRRSVIQNEINLYTMLLEGSLRFRDEAPSAALRNEYDLLIELLNETIELWSEIDRDMGRLCLKLA